MKSIYFDKARVITLVVASLSVTAGLPYLSLVPWLESPFGRYVTAPALTLMTYWLVWRTISILLSNWRAVAIVQSGVRVQGLLKSKEIRWSQLDDARVSQASFGAFSWSVLHLRHSGGRSGCGEERLFLPLLDLQDAQAEAFAVRLRERARNSTAAAHPARPTFSALRTGDHFDPEDVLERYLAGREADAERDLARAGGHAQAGFGRKKLQG